MCLPKSQYQVLESDWTGNDQFNKIRPNDSQERNAASVVNVCMSTPVLKGPLKGQRSAWRLIDFFHPLSKDTQLQRLQDVG